MSWDIAVILGVDGLANGAVYLLAGLGLVLIFSVTRVVFVPFGDIAVFAALSVAAFETRKVPPTIVLVAILAALAVVVEIATLLRRHEPAKIPRALLMYGLLPAVPCVFAALLVGTAVPHALFVGAAILLVVPIGPLVARLALQPIA
ncbi:MAG: branched-chain amino acid ABC transporter permease, partial [Burkholderiaceae bacterium]